MKSLGTSARTTIHRVSHKAVAERAVLYAILDLALVGHVGIVEDDQPYVVPVAIARDEDRLLLHGSVASRLFKKVASGAPCAVSVTILDALVLARSAFESSMNYRSAMVLGSAEQLEGAEKVQAFEALIDHLLPERRKDLRPINEKESRATTILALSLEEASVKISNKFPADSDEDLDWPIWSGNIPIEHRYGKPIPDPRMRENFSPPEYLNRWSQGRT